MGTRHTLTLPTPHMPVTRAMQPTTKKIIADVALFALSQVAFFYAFKYVMSSVDPASSKRKEAKGKSKAAQEKLNLKEPIQLSEHEEVIMGEVIGADDIVVKFADIGGLDPIIDQLREAVIFPLVYPKLFNSGTDLYNSPKGVLLYGPPGCGKTMMAKALAKESGATFINLPVSTLTDKWFGESNKLVAATFSLARKLQPAVIFIDEIDALMRERSRNDHEVTTMMKSEFMSLWDGLTTGSDSRVMVLGATNRPTDIDAAIMRRMPKRFAVGLPDATQRRKILSLMLKDIPREPSFDISEIVRKTEGFSGSDLKEASRNAAMVPKREFYRRHAVNGKLDHVPEGDIQTRPIKVADFFGHEGSVHRHVSSDTTLPPLD